MLFLLETIYI